jgi:hypothetical protein
MDREMLEKMDKKYRKAIEFIDEVESGKKAILITPKYVIIDKKSYQEEYEFKEFSKKKG